MSTKEQADFFSRVLDAETARGAQLSERAKWYLSLSAVYSAAVTLVAKDKSPEDLLQFTVFFIAIFGMVSSFLVSIWSVRVATYEGICKPEQALEKLVANRFNEQRFYIDRISDYVVASTRNAKVHARQAAALSISGYLLLLGMVAHSAYFAIRLYPERPHEQVREATAGQGVGARPDPGDHRAGDGRKGR
jgi:hypothetical protein